MGTSLEQNPVDHFWHKLKGRSWRDYIISWDFVMALTSGAISYALWRLGTGMQFFQAVVSDRAADLLVGCFGLTVAVFTVFVTFSEGEFYEFLRRKGTLKDLTFVFEFAIMSGMVAVVLMATSGSVACAALAEDVEAHRAPSGATACQLVLITSTATYSLVNGYECLKQIASYAYRREEFSQKRQKAD